MKRLFLSLLMALLIIATTGQMAFAFLTAPTSMSVKDVNVFRNLAETGDMLVVFHYKVAYGAYPTTPASDSIIFRLYAVDGTTLLNQSRPYNFSSFATNGYGDGVASFYFTAADAPTWGLGYFLDILVTPAYYSPSTSITYELTASDYSAAVTQTDARYDLYNYVIGLCDDLKDIYPTVSLKAVTDSGTVLSVYGEPYFRAVIPGLQSLSPQLFFVQTTLPTAITVVPYSMNATMTAGVLSGSDLERGARRIGETFGDISANAVFGGMFFIISTGICVLCYRKGWGVEPALMICVLLGIGSALIVGGFFFTLTMVFGLVGGMGISYIFLFRRA